jgi:hypothetical protein
MRQLTDPHKQQLMEVAIQFLQRYEKYPDLLARIVTGDEAWIHNFEPESNRQSMEWKHPGSP